MPSYVPNNLHEFQHQKPKNIQQPPHKWERSKYGAAIQWYKRESKLAILPE